MKKYISYMAFCLLALLTACNTADLVDIPSQGDGRITLSFTTQGDETRAVDLNSVGAEAKVTHIDLFIVKTENGSQPEVKHERLTAPAQGTPVTLTSITKKDLQSGTTQIYGVANSTKSVAEMDALAENFNLGNLQKAVERTDYIHLTGANVEGVPEAFLMWGQAKYGSATEITVDDSVTGDVGLTIVLVRAAAKVTINFKLPLSNRQLDGFGLPSEFDETSKAVDLSQDITYAKAGSYYLRNMPYKSYFAESFYVDNSNKDKYLRKTNEIDYGYYNWTSDKVTVTAYVYSYEWAVSNSSFESEPTMIVNLPAVQKDDATTGTYLDNNYYEIPLRMPGKNGSNSTYDKTENGNNYLQLKRNHHYVINATVNAPGSKSKFEPMEIEHIDYAEYPWRETTVNIGGDGGAKYLTLNTYDFDMRNIKVDNSTLKFYSSSPLTNIELLSASYIDKFGQTVQMRNDNDYTNIINNIEATYTNGAITGPITIDSPLPENDAVRSMRFKVTNEDGLTQEFTVDQYPAITITNQQAFFSYRLDFESHYTNKKQHSSGNYRASASWKNNRWSYEYDKSGNMFVSKYASVKAGGTSNIYYYYWAYNKGKYTFTTERISSLNNARIYHVTVNATSKDYTIARPRMTDDGYTDSGVDNSKLVSPSFMIASQLGATQSGYDLEKAKQHCKQYVEVYLDENGKEVHLTGWRLPTAAEIKIITERQYQTNAAVDEVLGGRYYHSASGQTLTRQSNDDGTYTRCIRDHFEEVAPKN